MIEEINPFNSIIVTGYYNEKRMHFPPSSNKKKKRKSLCTQNLMHLHNSQTMVKMRVSQSKSLIYKPQQIRCRG